MYKTLDRTFVHAECSSRRGRQHLLQSDRTFVLFISYDTTNILRAQRFYLEFYTYSWQHLIPDRTFVQRHEQFKYRGYRAQRFYLILLPVLSADPSITRPVLLSGATRTLCWGCSHFDILYSTAGRTDYCRAAGARYYVERVMRAF